MIPKIIHYVWVGPRPIPKDDKERIHRWKKLHPGWEFILWNNDNIDLSGSYIRQAYAMCAWNRISDYARMAALKTMGGVYLDTDVDLIRPLDPLLDHSAFLGFQAGDETPNELVNGAVIGAVPDHWLPSTIMRYFDDRMDGRHDTGPFSGPGIITSILRERGLKHYAEGGATVDDVTIFPKAYFYPYSWTETYTPDVISADTYAVHRWSESWAFRKSVFKRLKRKLTYLPAKYVCGLAFRYQVMNARLRSRLAREE